MALGLIGGAVAVIVALYLGIKIIKNLVVTAVMIAILLGVLWYAGLLTL